MADYSSAFGSSGPTFNPGLSFGSSAPSLGKSLGGSGMAFPFLAAASLGSSVLGGIFGGMQQNRQTQAQFQIAAAQERAARDAAFQNKIAGQYALTGARLFDQGLQRDAANYQQAFLDPRANQLESESRQRLMSDALSPNAQKLRRQQNVDELNRTLATSRARTDAMFGQVRQDPFAYGNVPSYAA